MRDSLKMQTIDLDSTVTTDSMIMVVRDSDSILNKSSALPTSIHVVNESKEAKISDNTYMQFGISIFVSVCIFVLTFIINELLRRWNKRKELVLYKYIIEELWIKSHQSIDEYTKALDKFELNIKENDDLNVAMWETPAINVSKLRSIGVDKIADTLEINLDCKNKKLRKFNMMTLLFQLDYIDNVSKEVRKVYEEYYEQSQKLMDEWNQSYIRLIDLTQKMSTLTDLNSLESEYLGHIRNLIDQTINSQPSGSVGVSQWNQRVIFPAQECINNITRSRENGGEDYVRILDIINTIKIFEQLFIRYMSLKGFAHTFTTYKMGISESNKQLSDAVSFISKHQLKSFWKIK